ncbi:MAG: class IV adenylate cyclase [Erysipelotrichales bacterium]|nr:class IV adenylate cyclase [Erysipelotrichales bacterium]
MTFGERLKKLRMDKNMTQEELASVLFVSNKTVSSWEMDRTEPSMDLIIKLADLFECYYSYLIYGNSKKNDIETEVKIKLERNEFKDLEILMNKDAIFINESRQVDTYYQPKYRKFLKNDDEEVEEWLRIGIRGNKKILNYKHWYDNKYCDEFEVSIDDEENLDKIFNILDLGVIAVVDKTRKKYMYLDKYEVSLDYVESLGYFVEIEVKEYSKDAIEEYDDLINLIRKLNLNIANIDKRGYPYHIIYKDV